MAADPNTDETATQRFQRAASASQLLREANFPLVMRGYDRHASTSSWTSCSPLVQDLESRQTREGVVQKALDELGEETAGILQRAHETADDITSRSRAQADARLQRAEREAEILRRDADEYAEQVITDTRALWEERQRLIEDIRQLADDVLGTADDAIERLKLPEALGAAEAAHGLEPAEALEPADGLEPAEASSRPEASSPPKAWSTLTRRSRSIPWIRRRPTSRRRRSRWPPRRWSSPDLASPRTRRPRTSACRGGMAETEAREESGHTVELEALPGGAEDPADLDRE